MDKKKKRNLLILFFSYGIYFSVNYFVFIAIQAQTSKDSEKMIEAILQQQFTGDNDPYKIAQTLTSFESLHVIHCSKLVQDDGEKEFINLQGNSFDCLNPFSAYLFRGVYKNVHLKSMNGMSWHIEFRSVNRPLHFILWIISTLSGATLILVLLYFQNKIQKERQLKIEQLRNLADQISHDIQSPLRCLKRVIEDLNGQIYPQKKLLESVAGRIEGILSSLKETKEVILFSKTLINLPQLLDEIIAEKKITLPPFCQLEMMIDSQIKESFLILGDFNQIQRVISNIINNAIESLNQEERGVITISFAKESINHRSAQAVVTVQDNGRGIPKEILPHLGHSPISYGKKQSQRFVRGKGLFHAQQVLVGHGGSLSITSVEKNGTKVKMAFPLAVVA